MVKDAEEILLKFYEKYLCKDLDHEIIGEEVSQDEFKYTINWGGGTGSLFICGAPAIEKCPVNWRFQILDLPGNHVASYGPIVYDNSVGDSLAIKNFFFRTKLAEEEL